MSRRRKQATSRRRSPEYRRELAEVRRMTSEACERLRLEQGFTTLEQRGEIHRRVFNSVFVDE